MLRDRGLASGDALVLPAERPAIVDESLRAIGIAPEDCRQLARGHVLAAEELTVVACDRFHHDLLAGTRRALAPAGRVAGSRRPHKPRRGEGT